MSGLIYNLSGAQVSMPFYRITTLGAFRSSQTVLLTNPPTPPITPGNDSDYPTTALQFIMNAPGPTPAPYRALEWLRGIPDAITTTAGTYHPTSTFTTRLNAFFAALTASGNNWALNVLDRTQPFANLASFNQTTGVIAAPAHGVPVNGRVYKVRVKGTGIRNYLNQIWSVIAPDANTLQVQNWQAPTIPAVIFGKTPTVHLQSYIQVQINAVSVGIISAHKCGRPSNLLGGRRKTRQTTGVFSPVVP
jgi:hypothetical protein